MPVVEKNALEYRYLVNLTSMIQYASWFTFILVCSFLPAVSFSIFIVYSPKAKSKVKSKRVSLIVKSVKMVILIFIIPSIIFIGNRPKYFYQLHIDRVMVEGTSTITLNLTSIENFRHDDERFYLSQLLNKSESLLGNLLEDVHGFGDCGSAEMHRFPRDILFKLASNIVNLKQILAFRNHFLFCLAPLPMLFHVYYCYHDFK